MSESALGGRLLPKYVHLDMKGGPPTLSYLLTLLPMFKEWGTTGLVVEWEDMFPWSGSLSMLARPGHYTLGMVGELLRAAEQHKLEVVPLVQTFGHMEFVLKHEQFKHLREMEMFPNSMMPVAVDSEERGVRVLVTEMVRQVVAAHPSLTTIHIGCDEVWCLGQSGLTRQHLETRGRSVIDVFLEHTAMVATAARQMRTGVKVLVWDDMMRTASVEQLLEAGLDKLVQPVIWSYGQVLAFPPGMLERYQSVWGEGNIWGGSAWRGATGSNMQATTIRHHLDNHLAWLSVLQEMPDLAGIVLTGWARYDHYATLCELLPVSLPSLRCCLAVFSSHGWTPDSHKQCSASLSLQENLMLEPYMFLTGDEPEHPTFPGSNVYSMVLAYVRLAAQFNDIMNSPARATWLNQWQVERGFLNPLQVQVTMHELAQIGSRLKALSKSMEKELTDLLHDFTADEWVHTNITPKTMEIDQLVSRVRQQLKLD
eukprot:GFUD01010622.1.p1 GENE.GFUD01010622.1~~GFUD01010622.1.p1  ORF type:complete len:482 (+),score=150.92 GFUD01010622.1:370-1815(+)